MAGDDVAQDILTDERLRAAHLAVSAAFSPSAPISRRDLFAGRTGQLASLLDIIHQAGQHAIIYGERGVGKTSLAAVMEDMLAQSDRYVTARVNCDGSDEFSSIWRKLLAQIRYDEREEKIGFTAAPVLHRSTVAQFLGDGEITPADLTNILRAVTNGTTPILFIDEFDRVGEGPTRPLIADLIKALSDQLVDVTIVLVGVADTVDDLLESHRSVERSLVQVRMPRMSTRELREIVDAGLGTAGMTSETEATSQVTTLSQGLPHYTHLLAQAAARTALGNHRLQVSVGDVDQAIAQALEKAQQSTARAYHEATSSSRETLYPQVLLACALTRGDDLGYFAAGDIREPLRMIMGKRYEIPAYSRHLHAMSENDRGPILQKTGQTRRYRFRFINPLLQPYIVMKGLAEGLVEPDVLARLE